MPKRIIPLNNKEIAGKSRAEGQHAIGDPPGLYLEVAGNSACWIYRAVIGGVRKKMGFGTYQEVSIDKAKALAREARDVIKSGGDPIIDRQAKKDATQAELIATAEAQARKITFDEFAKQYIADHEPSWQNAKHAQQWASTLQTYASPVIGSVPLEEINFEMIEAVLRPIWHVKTETASRVRGRIEAILSAAKVKKLRHGDNPAAWRGNLDQVFAAREKVTPVVGQPSLHYDEIGAFMQELRGMDGIGARALQFAVLNCSRSEEVRGATWAEINLGDGLWTIPASRMKKRKEHRIPLSQTSIDLLNTMPRFAATDLIFPGLKSQQMSDATLNATLKRMHAAKRERDSVGWVDRTVLGDSPRIVQHGFRSTFKSWAMDKTHYENQIIEFCLAHLIGSKSELAYWRSDVVEKRRQILGEWADFINLPARQDAIEYLSTARVLSFQRGLK